MVERTYFYGLYIFVNTVDIDKLDVIARLHDTYPVYTYSHSGRNRVYFKAEINEKDIANHSAVVLASKLIDALLKEKIISPGDLYITNEPRTDYSDDGSVVNILTCREVNEDGHGGLYSYTIEDPDFILTYDTSVEMLLDWATGDEEYDFDTQDIGQALRWNIGCFVGKAKAHKEFGRKTEERDINACAGLKAIRLFNRLFNGLPVDELEWMKIYNSLSEISDNTYFTNNQEEYTEVNRISFNNAIREYGFTDQDINFVPALFKGKEDYLTLEALKLLLFTLIRSYMQKGPLPFYLFAYAEEESMLVNTKPNGNFKVTKVIY